MRSKLHCAGIRYFAYFGNAKTGHGQAAGMRKDYNKQIDDIYLKALGVRVLPARHQANQNNIKRP